MFEKLASFVYRNSGRVLLVALVGVGVAGVFGLGVAKRLSPYGDTDPSTQSVQATNRYQAATGRQIDPGVIALVRLGDVHTAGAERRVSRVAARLRSSRDIASVASYYDTHDPAMLSRDGRSTYVVAYFDPKSDSRIQEDAQRLEREFAATTMSSSVGRRSRARRPTRRSAAISGAPSCSRSRSSSCSRCCSSARWSPRCCRRCSECWRSSPRSSRCGSSRASSTCRCSLSTSSPALGSGWPSTTACSRSPAIARSPLAPASASRRSAGRSQPPAGRSLSAR